MQKSLRRQRGQRQVVTLDHRSGFELARLPVPSVDAGLVRAASESERTGLAYMISPRRMIVFRFGRRIIFP